MRPAVLHLDDSLVRQPTLLEAVRADGGSEIHARDLGPALRLWTRAPSLAALNRRLAEALPERREPQAVFAGSGDFHHVAQLLIARAAARSPAPLTVIHFDNHPDWVRFAAGRHCGSWVGPAARLPNVARVVTVGVCSPDIGRRKAHEGDLALIAEGRLDLFAWTAPDGGAEVSLEGRAWPTISALGEAAFLDHLDAAVGASDIYVTLDKDVLRPEDALTNWDQGQASLDFVANAIRRLAHGRRLRGLDVFGDWSRPAYGGGVESLLKRGEALLDQPWRGPDARDADRVNQGVNLCLLELVAELSA